MQSVRKCCAPAHIMVSCHTEAPTVILQFPVELREGLWGLSIGCEASLGFPKGNLTMMRKLPGERTFTAFVPQVEKAAELRKTETDSKNICITDVVYEFDTNLQGWNMTEFRCAITTGTDNEVLSDVGVFEVVPSEFYLPRPVYT